jgi:D-aminopeptidase
LRIGELEAGPRDSIADVAGVRVGHTTLIEGEDVRTGVTVVVPPELPLFAGAHRLNGNGELTGLEWIRESGLLTTPIGLTNTHSVGVVRDAIVAAMAGSADWSLPVVGETWDGVLNDINAFHVRPEHLHHALAAASAEVAQGNVGSGTGMICHGFKGGIGTASRRAGEDTVGVLVQANHGRRTRLRVDGAPVGRELGFDRIPGPEPSGGSIIVVVATDAPLLPHQCDRVAQRAALGVARTGGAGENSSGDLLLCFSTQTVGETVRMRPDESIDALFYAAIEATEAAIVNALLAAETMTGRGGATVHAIDHDALAEIVERHR